MLLSIAVMGIFYACEKDEEQVNGEQETNFTLTSFFKRAAAPTQVFYVNTDTASFITGEKGVRVYFNQNTFYDNANNPINGSIEIHLREILTYNDMILSGITTNVGNDLLVSGGQVYLMAYQNGSPLNISGWGVLYFTVPTDNPDPNMGIYYGTMMANQEIDGDSNIIWNVRQPSAIDSFASVIYTSYDSSFGEIYVVVPDSLGFINCDYPFTSSNPRVKCSLLLPEEYSQYNTISYLVFPQINSIARLSQSYLDTTDKQFYSFPIPNDLSVKVATISVIDSVYYYSNSPLEPVSETTISLVPVEASYNDIVNAIQNL